LSKHDFVLILITKFQLETLQKFCRDKICVDGTHGTNAYDIQLYTVVTVENLDPVTQLRFVYQIDPMS